MSTYSRCLTVVLALAVFLPVAAHALTNDEIRQEIALLLAQISAIQAQINAVPASVPNGVPPVSTPTPSNFCPSFSRTLSRGMRGEEVRALQQFLIGERVLAADSDTGFFGPATEAAVKNWQSSKQIVSSGDSASTGWGSIGPRTRALMRVSCGGAGDISSGLFGGRLTVSSSGLSVTVSVAVNTKGSCEAVVYELDFGDGSPMQEIGVPANACTEKSMTFSHAYKSAGSYTVALRAGSLYVPISITLKAPTYASSSPVVTSAASSTAPVASCPIYFKPTCTTDVLTWLGNDSNNCSLGYRCVPKLVTCSPVPNIVCLQGYTAVPGGYDAQGCVLPSQCLATQALCPQYAQPFCTSSQHVVSGTYNSSTGCYGAPQCVAN